jgi:hypothetical protein
VSVAAHVRYILRRGEYSDGSKEVAHWENLVPDWAAASPSVYWNAADRSERKNARLGRSFDIALPNELSKDQQITLAKSFVEELTTEGNYRMPYIWALHGKPGNPHIHIILSERLLDRGRKRDAKTWFKRASPDGNGGAPKSRAMTADDWLKSVRKLWEQTCNAALSAAGLDQRIDARSHRDRGISSPPGRHIGPFLSVETRAAHELSALQAAETAMQTELTALVAPPPSPPAPEPAHYNEEEETRYAEGMAALAAACDAALDETDDDDDRPGLLYYR